MSKWIAAALVILFCLIPRVGHAGDKVVKYGSFNHRQIELRLEVVTRRVSLCVARVDPYEVPVWARDSVGWMGLGGNELPFLISEVQRLVAQLRPAKIDDGKPSSTGDTFYFRSGLPIWGPYEEVTSAEDDYECLMFAHHARYRRGLIYAKGLANPVGYYGYGDARMVHGGAL